MEQPIGPDLRHARRSLRGLMYAPTLAHASAAVFRAAQQFRSEGHSGGSRWERTAAEAVSEAGRHRTSCRSETMLGRSGSRYQTDSVFECVEGVVFAEWKAHQDSPPRSSLLSFIASTDDIFDACPRQEPMLRMFGGPVRLGTAHRTLAAWWGCCGNCKV